MKILCLGNNTEDTDIKTRELARTVGQPCYGLLSELEGALSAQQYAQNGYYHSSVYDLKPGNLATLLKEFDQVIMLDQPKSAWSHPYAFNNTIAAIKSVGPRGSFANPALAATHDTFDQLVRTNKSFCVFPFIQLYTFSDGTATCCRSSKVITKIKDFTSWRLDKNYQEIRQKMLDGVLIPDHCGFCYRQEAAGMLSPRQAEITEWVQRLDINSIQDLTTLEQPAYYDIRPSNKCNLMCRMCNPDDSHLIAQEYKTLNMTWPGTAMMDAPKHYVGFDVVDINTVKKLSVAGGEPSIMAEFIAFLETCIDLGRTDFEISITTNATKFGHKFKRLLEQFSNVNFIVSVDGYDQLNHYIRYPSVWNDIVNNMRYLQDQHYLFSTHTTISIYNINSLHLIFEYMDREFPGVIADWDFVENPSFMSPYQFPDSKSVVDSLTAVINTNCYKNAGQIFRERINNLLEYFVNRSANDVPKLQEFFSYNDKLDQSRSIQLINYVPLLDKHRYTTV